MKIWETRNQLEFVKESRAYEGQQPCKKLGFKHRSAEGARDTTAERALRVAPVSKEPPAAREQGPRVQCKNPEG